MWAPSLVLHLPNYNIVWKDKPPSPAAGFPYLYVASWEVNIQVQTHLQTPPLSKFWHQWICGKHGFGRVGPAKSLPTGLDFDLGGFEYCTTIIAMSTHNWRISYLVMTLMTWKCKQVSKRQFNTFLIWNSLFRVQPFEHVQSPKLYWISQVDMLINPGCRDGQARGVDIFPLRKWWSPSSSYSWWLLPNHDPFPPFPGEIRLPWLINVRHILWCLFKRRSIDP